MQQKSWKSCGCKCLSCKDLGSRPGAVTILLHRNPLRDNRLLEPEFNHLRDVAPVVEVRDRKEHGDRQLEDEDPPHSNFGFHVCIMPRGQRIAREILFFSTIRALGAGLRLPSLLRLPCSLSCSR
jgi:hypothetical protein